MTYKQRENAREIRLWIGQVIVPVATGIALIASNPVAREEIKAKFNEIKEKIRK